jgi:colanic acid/amylovoran biosynthesis glycosyltransferase
LDKVKGHLYCIEVANLLINNGIDLTLTIIGEGEERTSLEKLIVQNQLKGKVFIKGKKSPKDVREAFWNHDIYLLTAIALADGRRETQGLATLEAQACGLPVVVFDSGGVKYTVDEGETGFVCEEYDIQSVAKKIMLFNNNQNLLNKMSRSAVAFINNEYSQKIIDEKWGVIYDKILMNKNNT